MCVDVEGGTEETGSGCLTGAGGDAVEAAGGAVGSARELGLVSAATIVFAAEGSAGTRGEVDAGSAGIAAARAGAPNGAPAGITSAAA